MITERRRELAVCVFVACALMACPCQNKAPFTLLVIPTEITDSVPDQRCVFLVTVEDVLPPGLDEPVHITASVPGADVMVENADILSGDLLPGDVAEVSVVPLPLEKQALKDGRMLYGTVTGESGGHECVRGFSVFVTSEEVYDLEEAAAAIRDLFVPWLAENEPGLGITAETEWAGTIVTPHILIVTHYLFFSEEWEAHVFWHVMIPPHDWARIELRRRFVETAPSLAFEISSVDAGPPHEVIAIEPAPDVWR